MANKSNLKTSLVMAVMLFGFGCTIAKGDVIYVDANGSADFETIQEAINNSNNGDEIVVAEGTYIENINFVGKNIILRSKDPNDSAVVAATVIDGNDANSVVTFSGTEDSNCVLTGFTITGGKKGMPLYVDIQDIFGDVEPNWIGLDEDEVPISLSADFDDNFTATLEYGLLLDNGDWQTQYPPGPDIADVLEDGYRRFQDGDVITLTFSNLKAGDYFIVTYHVDMDHNGGTTEGTFKVFVDGEVVGGYAATVGRDAALPEGSIGFEFTSNGVDDVVIEFDGEAVEPDVDEVWLNGFGLMGLGPLCRGGGIAGNGCSATISKCVITENWANVGGGVDDCDGLIENNIIRNNVADDILPPGPLGAIGVGGGLSGCDGTIARNKISGNYAFAGGGMLYCDGTVINNLLVGNMAVYGGGVADCDGSISNCTVVGNYGANGHALYECTGIIANCVIWQNGAGAIEQIKSCSTPIYSCIEGWDGAGIGNISADPCFGSIGYWQDMGSYWEWVDNDGDYHLQSQAGRWDPNTSQWVIDANTSLCIDAGNPGCPLRNEPNDVNNIRINMGAFGGTAEASKTPANWRSIADLTNDWVVDFNDLAAFVLYWLDNGQCIPSDLNRSESVNFVDFAVFTQQRSDTPVAEPSIAYEITPCDLGLLAAEQSGQTRFTVTVEGGYIHFEDMMVANCCPDELELEMIVEDNLITIYEIEHTTMPCLCICDYPVTATLGPFAPGTYTLEVYEDWGGFIGSTIVTID